LIAEIDLRNLSAEAVSSPLKICLALYLLCPSSSQSVSIGSFLRLTVNAEITDSQLMSARAREVLVNRFKNALQVQAINACYDCEEEV
jgi:hypothetical protein